MSTYNSENTPSLSEHLSALLDDEAGSFEQQRVLNELQTDAKLCQKFSTFALIGESIRSGDQATISANQQFLAQIQNRLSDEPTYSVQFSNDTSVAAQNKKASIRIKDNASSVDKGNSWLRPIGGFALAASVAAITVIGFQNYLTTSTNTNDRDQIVSSTAHTIISANLSDVNKRDISASKEKLSQAEMDSAVVVSADTLQREADLNKRDQLANAKSSDIYQQADARTRSLLKRYVDTHMQYASNSAFVPSVRVIAYSD